MAADFDIEFEEQILAAAMRDADFLKKAIRVCDAHHFGSAERSWVWEVVRGNWTKYKELVNPTLIIARAKHTFPDEAKREPYLKTAAKILRTKPTYPKSALEDLEKFVRFVNMQLAAEKIADALERKDIDAAEKALRKASGVAVGTRKYTLVNWIEEFDERQAHRKYEKEHPESTKAILTGWKKFDSITNGIHVGELGLVMGVTGMGKSVVLTNLTQAAASRGHNALYIGFEMPARQVAARQDANWLGMDYASIKRHDLAPSDLRSIKSRLEKAKKHFGNKIKIASFPVRSASILDVRGLLDDLRDEQEWRPDVILFDSGDHLRAIDSMKEAFRLQQSEVYWAMKGLAEDDGYAVWSSVHAGKEWAGEIATAEASSESYDKSRIADLVISVNDPERGRKRKKAKVEVSTDDDDLDEAVETFEAKEASKSRRLDLHLAKYRDGESRTTIPMKAEFTIMKITELEDERSGSV